MSNIEILKRLYKDYTRKYLDKIFLAAFFSILVAGSTSATAWLLDPAIDKIFLNKDKSLLLIIPILIILAFATKGISLYLARVSMIRVAEEVMASTIAQAAAAQFSKTDDISVEPQQVNYAIQSVTKDTIGGHWVTSFNSV